MDTRTNEFYEAEKPRDPSHLSFGIGDEIMLKGHIFKIHRICKGPHELVLRPIRPATDAEKRMHV